MSHHYKCGACGLPLSHFAEVELHRPIKDADESRARCVADGEWWPCVAARLAHIRTDQQRSLDGDLPEDQEIKLGRERNRWLEDEVRRLALLVQEVAVERDRLRTALTEIVILPSTTGRHDLDAASINEAKRYAREALGPDSHLCDGPGCDHPHHDEARHG